MNATESVAADATSDAEASYNQKGDTDGIICLIERFSCCSRPMFLFIHFLLTSLFILISLSIIIIILKWRRMDKHELVKRTRIRTVISASHELPLFIYLLVSCTPLIFNFSLTYDNEKKSLPSGNCRVRVHYLNASGSTSAMTIHIVHPAAKPVQKGRNLLNASVQMNEGTATRGWNKMLNAKQRMSKRLLRGRKWANDFHLMTLRHHFWREENVWAWHTHTHIYTHVVLPNELLI